MVIICVYIVFDIDACFRNIATPAARKTILILFRIFVNHFYFNIDEREASLVRVDRMIAVILLFNYLYHLCNISFQPAN